MTDSITSESSTSTETSDNESDHSSSHDDRGSHSAWAWFFAGICWDFFLFACIFGTTLLGIYGECTNTGKMKTPSQFRHWKSPLQVCIGAVAATRRPVWWWMMKGKQEWAWMANLVSLDQAWTVFQWILLTLETYDREIAGNALQMSPFYLKTYDQETAGNASNISPLHLTNPALFFEGLFAIPSPSSALFSDVQGQSQSAGPLPNGMQTSDTTQAAAEASFGVDSGGPEDAPNPETSAESAQVDCSHLPPTFDSGSSTSNDPRLEATPTPNGPLQANTSQTSTDSAGMRERRVRSPHSSLDNEGRGSAESFIGVPDTPPSVDRDTADKDIGGLSVRDWRQILEERIVDRVCPDRDEQGQNFREEGYSEADCTMLEGLENAWLSGSGEFPTGYKTLDGKSFEEIKQRRKKHFDAGIAEKRLSG